MPSSRRLSSVKKTPNAVARGDGREASCRAAPGRPATLTRHHNSMFQGVEALMVLLKAHRSLGITQLADALVLASSNAALRGTRKVLVPRVTGSFSARYRFAGALKGLAAGASLRYTGGYVRGNPTATRRYEEAAPKQIYAAFLSYGWRSGRLSHTLRLNGNNVFDKLVVGPDLNLSLGRQLLVTYTVSFR